VPGDPIDRGVEVRLGRLSESLCPAADKLRSLLDASDERIALGAARTMLELVPKLRADGELADAVRDLERRLLHVMPPPKPKTFAPTVRAVKEIVPNKLIPKLKPTPPAPPSH
jgi:hypothetical protein